MRRLTLLSSVVVVLAVSLGFSGGASPSVQPRWVITDLGTLGGVDSYAYALNGRGQVVCASETETTGALHAFLWSNGHKSGQRHAVLWTLRTGS